MLHTVRDIQRNDDTRAAFAKPRGNALDLLHHGLREREGQQQDSQAAEQQQQKVPQTKLRGSNMDTPVQELHRRPVRALDPFAVEQVRQDR